MSINKEIIKNQLKKLDETINKKEDESPKIEIIDKRYKKKKL